MQIYHIAHHRAAGGKRTKAKVKDDSMDRLNTQEPLCSLVAIAAGFRIWYEQLCHLRFVLSYFTVRLSAHAAGSMFPHINSRAYMIYTQICNGSPIRRNDGILSPAAYSHLHKLGQKEGGWKKKNEIWIMQSRDLETRKCLRFIITLHFISKAFTLCVIYTNIKSQSREKRVGKVENVLFFSSKLHKNLLSKPEIFFNFNSNDLQNAGMEV